MMKNITERILFGVKIKLRLNERFFGWFLKSKLKEIK
jgi:hypothetical protein